ncbi:MULTISPECIES: ParA family protein [unclassified Sphingomonas]|jgi:chromosome partitioning protein|uniref:ParA family protein n=1 Tax=unclassified Sphingomonas TaxID=196159 RepID=UPI000E1082A5|nr:MULTISPECIES: ParA family protein [unclassified Sphingomonas]AXJ96017.1 ParA family protein [Sphingomonas sp. FARSPH]
MATIAVYSSKGGVGKTTLAVNLAWCAATLSHRRTLLWDLDPQGASSWIMGDHPTRTADRAQAIFTRDIDAAGQIRATAVERLDLIAADASLRNLDVLLHRLGKRGRLGKLIGGIGDYDHVVLDCPPGLTETSEQVIRAADLIVMPVVPSPLAQRAHDEVVRHLGGKVPVLPVHSMVDRRRRLHADALAAQPDWPAIPMASAMEAMASRRRPLGVYAPRTAAAQALAALWTTIERRLST